MRLGAGDFGRRRKKQAGGQLGGAGL